MELTDKDGFVSSLLYFLWLKDPIKMAGNRIPEK
jgi:hypothetical protein